jgi:uncharacterized HAD superfamily protein
MSRRSLYVDIDDVLSQTIESLIDLLHHLHDRRVDVADVQHFDLEKSFALDRTEIARFMDHAHSDEIIESILPTEGAVSVLDSWGQRGDTVRLVTGRPPTTYHASRRWLETHGLRHDSLHHLDKWQRPDWNLDELPALRFEDIEAFGFDFAVEDSLDTAVRLVEEYEIPVALMDRPWNRGVSHLGKKTRSRLVRCFGWGDVDKAIA